MQCDEVIWKTIAHQFCSFKVKTETQNFCRNENNLTGLCSKQSCPLSNSQYATIRPLGETGELYLMIKTIERAHLPKRMWQKIKLDSDYEKMIKQIDSELEYFPHFIIHKTKQRLTKLLEMQKRSKIVKNYKLQGVKKKVEKRDLSRQVKAEKQANLEQQIEKELLNRLKMGLYDGIYNQDEKEFEQALDLVEQELSEEYVSDDELDMSIFD